MKVGDVYFQRNAVHPCKCVVVLATRAKVHYRYTYGGIEVETCINTRSEFNRLWVPEKDYKSGWWKTNAQPNP